MQPKFTLSIVPFGRSRQTRVLPDLTADQVVARVEWDERETAAAHCESLQPGEGACFGYGVYGIIRTE